MRRKIEIFCACLMVLVVIMSFRNNFIFFSDHMATDDANLGIALAGFPFSLFLSATIAQIFLEKNKYLAGMIFVFMAPLLIIFEVVIYALQDFPSLFRLIMMILLYAAALIFGLVQVRRALKEKRKQMHGKIIIRN